jgi:hypothetical protein
MMMAEMMNDDAMLAAANSVRPAATPRSAWSPVRPSHPGYSDHAPPI